MSSNTRTTRTSRREVPRMNSESTCLDLHLDKKCNNCLIVSEIGSRGIEKPCRQFWKKKYDPGEGARMNSKGIPKRDYGSYLSVWKEIEKKGISTQDFFSVIPASSVDISRYPSQSGNVSRVSLGSRKSCASVKSSYAASSESTRIQE